MENEINPQEVAVTNEAPPKKTKRGLLIVILIVALLVGGGIYYFWPESDSSNQPPTLSTGEQSKTQGMIKWQGRALDAEDDLDFFEFKNVHVQAWAHVDDEGKTAEEKLQEKYGDPITVKAGIHYFHTTDEVSVSDLFGTYITNETEASFSAEDDITGMIQPKLATDQEADADEGIVFALWDNGGGDLEPGWQLFPAGPFDPEESSAFNVIADPDEFIIPKNRGFMLWSSVETTAYGIKDEKTAAEDYELNLSDDESGWIMLPFGSCNALNDYEGRVKSIWALNGNNNFVELEESDACISGDYKISWVGFGEDSETGEGEGDGEDEDLQNNPNIENFGEIEGDDDEEEDDNDDDDDDNDENDDDDTETTMTPLEINSNLDLAEQALESGITQLNLANNEDDIYLENNSGTVNSAVQDLLQETAGPDFLPLGEDVSNCDNLPEDTSQLTSCYSIRDFENFTYTVDFWFKLDESGIIEYKAGMNNKVIDEFDTGLNKITTIFGGNTDPGTYDYYIKTCAPGDSNCNNHILETSGTFEIAPLVHFNDFDANNENQIIDHNSKKGDKYFIKLGLNSIINLYSIEYASNRDFGVTFNYSSPVDLKVRAIYSYPNILKNPVRTSFEILETLPADDNKTKKIILDTSGMEIDPEKLYSLAEYKLELVDANCELNETCLVYDTIQSKKMFIDKKQNESCGINQSETNGVSSKRFNDYPTVICYDGLFMECNEENKNEVKKIGNNYYSCTIDGALRSWELNN